MPHRSPHRFAARRAALAAALATVLLAPSAAHATPPGANGDLLSNQRESSSYELFDPALSPNDQQSSFWADGDQRGLARSSPDGIHVAYWSATDDGIDFGDVDGTKIRKLTTAVALRDLVFSPDGTKVAYTQDDHIFTVPTDGSAGPVQLGGTFNGASGIEWAPDNSAIVVSSAGAGGDRDLYAVDPATGAGHPLTATAGLDEDTPSLSPDGTRLAFTAQDGTHAHDRIDIMNLDGGNRHTLLTETDVDWPQWAPDGTRIAFTTSGSAIATVKPDGTGRKDVAYASVTQLSWLIARGTANQAPSATFTVAPAQPFTGGDTTLTSTATDPDGTIASEQWDLDGDGQYDDATGHVAHVTFATAGAHTVALKVKDNSGTPATSVQTPTVLAAGKPGASFTVDPASPVLNQPATFTAAANVDPNAHVVHHEWDFDNDGTYDADGGEARTIQHIYSKIGSYTAKLRVTDADGDQASTTLVFSVRDEVRCGVEQIGRLTIDGCLTVKGQRRVAPNGVTVNGFTLGGTPDGAQVAIDVTGGRLFTIDGAQAQDFLDGRLNAPKEGAVPAVTVASCGEALGTSRPDLASFTNNPELDFTLASDKTFAGLAPRSASKLKLDNDGTGHFDVSGLFPRLLLNWTAEANGAYTANTDCAKRKLSVTVQSFFGRIVTMPQIRLERTGDDRWDGIADVRFGTLQTLPSAQAKATVRAGRISAVQLDFNDVPLTPGLRLKASNLTLRLDKGQEELTGQAEITSYPALFKQTLAYAKGAIRLNGTDGLHLEGLVKIMGQDLGWGWLDITDHSVDAGIEAQLTLGPAYAKAEISGYLGWSPLAFELLGHAEIGIKGVGSLSGSLLISSKGIAACGKLGFVNPGFSYRYGDDWPTVFLNSCDFGDLRVARASSASAAAAKVKTVTVAAKQRAVVIVAKGRPGRAPRVSVTGPHGQRITSKENGQATKTGRFLVVPNRQDGTTNVLVLKPAAGTWRIRSLDGRVIRRVGIANALPEPAVKVKHDKKKQRLSWTLRVIKGQTIKLVETSKDGKVRRLLKTTNKAKGTMKYVPTAPAAKIVAEVVQNGLPRETRTVVKLR